MRSKGNSDRWCLDIEQLPVTLLDNHRIAKLTEGLDRQSLGDQIVKNFCLASGRPDGCRYVFEVSSDGAVEILDFDGERLDCEELSYDDLITFIIAVYTAARTLSQDEEPLTLRNPFSGFKTDDYRVGLQTLIDHVKASVPVIILND